MSGTLDGAISKELDRRIIAARDTAAQVTIAL
jgi:hypothetical protein